MKNFLKWTMILFVFTSFTAINVNAQRSVKGKAMDRGQTSSSQMTLQLDKVKLQDEYKKPLKTVYLVPQGATTPIIEVEVTAQEKGGKTVWVINNGRQVTRIKSLLKQRKTLRLISSNYDTKKVTPTAPTGVATFTMKEMQGNQVNMKFTEGAWWWW